MDGGIRRLSGGVVVGRAVTAWCEPYTVGAMLRALRLAGEGDVLVVQGGGDWAYFGDLTAAEATRRGLAGVVVDGYVRDVEAIAARGLGLFARGTVAVGGKPGGAGDLQVTIVAGGQEVSPGDWVVGDADGVVVVPDMRVEDVAAAAEAATAREAESLARIDAGESFFDLPFQSGPSLGELLDR
jgi:regulator of RNase E activity RraA